MLQYTRLILEEAVIVKGSIISFFFAFFKKIDIFFIYISNAILKVPCTLPSTLLPVIPP